MLSNNGKLIHLNRIKNESTKVQNQSSAYISCTYDVYYAHAQAYDVETPPPSIKYTENSEEYTGPATAGLGGRWYRSIVL